MSGFQPPPYPYDRLDPLRARAAEHDGGVVDLSIGTPFDPAPQIVLDALASADPRGYPPSIGTPAFREAACAWIDRQLGVDLTVEQVAATIGSKEFVAGIPQWLKLRTPDRDTVLYPAITWSAPFEASAVTMPARAGCSYCARSGARHLTSLPVPDQIPKSPPRDVISVPASVHTGPSATIPQDVRGTTRQYMGCLG